MIVSLRNFAKHSSIYALGNIINRIGAFLLLPVYTHHLTTAQYGILELLYATSSLLTAFLGMSFSHACLRFYFEYEDNDKQKLVIGTILISSFFITAIGVLSLVPFTRELSDILFDSPDYEVLFYFTFLIFVISMSNEICLAYFRAREYSIRFIVLAMLQLLVLVAVNIYTVAYLELGVKGVLIGNLISVSFAWLYLFFTTIRENSLRFNREILRDIFHYTYPLLIASIALAISANADKYIIKSTYSLGAVGIFALSQKFSMLLEVLVADPFKKNFSPFRFSIMRRDDVGLLLSKLLNYFSIGIAFMALGLSFFVSDILFFMSDEAFWAAASIVPILLLAQAIRGVGYVFQTGIMYSKKTKYLMYIRISGAVLLIIFNLLLIPEWGTYGAAISRIMLAIFVVLTTFYLAQKAHYISYEYKPVIKILFISILVYLGFYVVKMFPLGLLPLIILKVFLLALFVTLIRTSGVLSRDDTRNIILFISDIKTKLIAKKAAEEK